MTSASSKRQPPRTQVAKRPSVDQAIYLRTYDVINSLDRAASRPWWEKALEKIRRPAPAIGSPEKVTLLAPLREMRILAPPALPKEATAEPSRAGTPVPARPLVEIRQQELALVRTNRPHVIESIADKNATPRPRRFSWVLLAVVAVVTAGITFAVIRLAWPSVFTGSGGDRPRHAATYITTRSEASSQLAGS